MTGVGGALERRPVGVGYHEDVAGSLLLGHDGNQSVAPETDRGHPVVLGHGGEATGHLRDCQKPLWRFILLGFYRPLPPALELSNVTTPRSLFMSSLRRSPPRCLWRRLRSRRPDVDCSGGQPDRAGRRRGRHPRRQRRCLRSAAGRRRRKGRSICMWRSPGRASRRRTECTAGYSLAGSTAGTAATATRRPLSRAKSACGPVRRRSSTRGFGPASASWSDATAARGCGESGAGRGRAPPAVGDERTFSVCQTDDCDDFVQVSATAQVVGQRVAIYPGRRGAGRRLHRPRPAARRRSVRQPSLSDRHDGVRR